MEYYAAERDNAYRLRDEDLDFPNNLIHSAGFAEGWKAALLLIESKTHGFTSGPSDKRDRTYDKDNT